MEDEKIRSLFTDFEPELSSDFMFMNKLQQSLDSVEIVRQHTAELRRRNKKAVVLAAAVGFIVGFLFSLSLPYLNNAIAKWLLSLPDASFIHTIANYSTVMAWLVIGATSVFAALNTYEISLSLLSTPKRQ